MENKLSVSQEIEFSKISTYEYNLPTNDSAEIICNLDARGWVNRSGSRSTMLCLFVTTTEKEKLKFYLFRNNNNRKYSPNSKEYSDFCCNDDLVINLKIRIYYERNSKSGIIYIRKLDRI